MTNPSSIPPSNDWPAFNDWAYKNEPIYHRVCKESMYLDLNQNDHYRMLIYAYVNEVNRLRDEHYEYCAANPAPVMGPEGQVWRYIGP